MPNLKYLTWFQSPKAKCAKVYATKKSYMPFHALYGFKVQPQSAQDLRKARKEKTYMPLNAF